VPSGQEAIWVIIDRLTKSAHFIPFRIIDSMEKMAELYVREIVRLYRVPASIVLDRDAWFTSKFLKKLQEAMGTKLDFGIAYHPQTDGQSERTIVLLIISSSPHELVVNFYGFLNLKSSSIGAVQGSNQVGFSNFIISLFYVYSRFCLGCS
jgi:hypothetical protein